MIHPRNGGGPREGPEVSAHPYRTIEVIDDGSR